MEVLKVFKKQSEKSLKDMISSRNFNKSLEIERIWILL